MAILPLVTLNITQIHSPSFRSGCVVSDSSIASEVGSRILQDGGNAIDAAVATGFALAVTFPAAGNIGGGGFMLVRMASGECVAIDYRETAPRAATRDMYLDEKGNVTKDSLTGYKAAGVPGTVLGLWEAHHRYGKLPWKKVMEPSIRLATSGFPLSKDLAASMQANSTSFRAFPASWNQFCRNGNYYQWGENFRQPELAKTLSLVQSYGPDGFYKGSTATKIAKAMRESGGLITEADLAEYQVKVRKPIHGSYKGWEIYTMPPPSSGGICLVQMLGILEGFDLKSAGHNSSTYLHFLTETMKLSFADRSSAMGDPDFVKVPIEQLLSKEYILQRRQLIREDRATPSEQINPGASASKEGSNTTHFSVVDSIGYAVSNTYTLNMGFGCGATVPGAGFLLNNEMDDFAAKVGTPNGFGLIQGENNSIQPLKRPLSSMTPTIITADGKLSLVLGSPGGPTIINTVLQTILNVKEFGMGIQRAVSAPRFHHQWKPDEIQYEPFGLGADLRAATEARGHKFASRGSSMGSCNAIVVLLSGIKEAGADPRVPTASAAGY